MRLRDGHLDVRRWWRTVDHLPVLPATEAERVEQFAELFGDAVAIRMRSDVPIGTCLSGGFDSSAVICTMYAHQRSGAGPRESTEWRHAFVASFPGASIDERPEAEQAAAYAGVTPNILEIRRNDALTDIDRILDDLDDVYIGLPSAGWQIYRELRRHHVLVSLDGHGADELMGAYRQEGRTIAFTLRNLTTRLSSRWSLARRGIDLMRASVIGSQGHYFLRGGLRDVPPPIPLVADNDTLPAEWGPLNRRLYRMFHGTVLPTILRNFDRASMAHGVEVRMPFMDWRLVTYTMALPDQEKSSGGYSKLIARRAMAGKMPEAIRMGRRKVGFNSPMPDWLNGPLSDWVDDLFDQPVPAFFELVDEARLQATMTRLTRAKAWDWEAAGRIWPYVNLRWKMARMSSEGVN
jgi:asparagine synthase (glutamine-hydrolysing)